MDRIETTEHVWKFNCCTGCGSCVGICPTGALQMRKHAGKGLYIPSLVNRENCSKCGFCSEVCPRLHPNLRELNLSVFGKLPEDNLIGNSINFYVGHSTNMKIRQNAASGGLATSLLIFALEMGIIDGAVVVKMKKNDPLEPEIFVAKTAEEVISACKSKYCPVPSCIAIKDILREKGKFAVVGLPCHIHGFRKAEAVNDKLKAKIVFHLGLFCSHTANFLGTSFLIEKMGCKCEDIVRIEYRGDGWPGGMTIHLKDGTRKFLPSSVYWGHFFSQYFFTPIYCTLCNDGLNELADLSIGDAWLPELADHTLGESMIVTRTKVGEDLLLKCVLKGNLELAKISRNDVIRAQREVLLYKKKRLGARMFVLKGLGKQFIGTEIGKKYRKFRLDDYLSSILTYFNIYVSSNQKLRWLLRYVSLSFFKLYKIFLNKAVNKPSAWTGD